MYNAFIVAYHSINLITFSFSNWVTSTRNVIIHIIKQCAFSLLATGLTLHISFRVRMRVKGRLVSPRLRSIARNSCGAATRRAQRRDVKQPSPWRTIQCDTTIATCSQCWREDSNDRKNARDKEGGRVRKGVSHGTNRALKAAASENNCSLTGREMNLFNFR